MTTALMLDLDERASMHVRRIWIALDAAGIQSLGTMSEAEAPHVSVMAFEGGDPDAFMREVELILPSLSPLYLTLDAVGVFPAPGVLFLGVVVTQQLVDFQRCVSEIATRHGGAIQEYYRSERWFPHCTLAMGLRGDDLAGALRIAAGIILPIGATATSIRFMDSAANIVLRTVALDGKRTH